MTFSRPVVNEAGETAATSDGMSGGVRQRSYQVQFSLASMVPGAVQPGLSMSVSPDRGDGARMSYLRFEDQSDGIHVFFADYQDRAPFGTGLGDDAGGCGAGGDDFFETDISTLDRSVPHTIKFVLVFVDGPRNDFVQIFIDGALRKTGTTWEDYYRYCSEQAPNNQTHTVDSLIFRTADAAPGTSGNGFLVDNMTESSGPATPTTVVVNHTDINNWLFYNDENDKVDPTLGSFVTGPGTTPLGTGSAQISVTGTQRRNLATYQFSGTPLAAITTLKYSTYNPSAGNGGGANRSGYMQFNVDFDGSDTFQHRLFFIPAVNGTVTPNNWKEWDTINGGNALWGFSGSTWPAGVGGGGEAGTVNKTWNQILSQYPGIRIRVTDSFLGIRVGEPYTNGYTENIDAIKFGTAAGATEFDFDPATALNVTPATAPNPLDNDYTRINNAVQAIAPGGTVTLNGTFDWREANAAASWALGSDGTSQAGGGDDYTILPPANKNNITITAPTVGGATIQGPGDVPTVNLEGVFQFFNDGDNQNWTFSNLRILDFDLAIGMFNGAGGSDAYNGTKIINNYILVAKDLSATAAPADTNQNIGINYSFGTNQLISGNTIDLHGDGVSNSGASDFSSEVAMQSNTSGGSVYEGLQITNNTVRVLNAQSADPEVILGIWENGHAHASNINVSGNQFVNLGAGNDPAVNLERGFRVTSHSSGSSTVTYANNIVQGANIGFQWISGSAFAGNQPVRLTSNTLTGNGTAVLVQSQGLASMSFNRIVGNTTGVSNVDGTVTAQNNWWGCNYGPGTGGAGCTGTPNGTTGTVNANPWLTLTTSAFPTSLGLGENSAVTSLLTVNSANATPGGGSVPNGIAANFAGILGTVAPASSVTTAGATGTTFTANAFGNGGVNTTIDSQLVNAAINISASCLTVSSPTTTTALTGTPVTQPLIVGDLTGRGVISYDTTVTYNPAVVTYSGFDQSSTVSSTMSILVNSSTPGTLVISAFQSAPITGSGTLLKLNFNAIGSPGTSSPINFGAFKFNEGTPCNSTSNGLITINSGTITGTITYGNSMGSPAIRDIPNATLNAVGSVNVSASTDALGTYTLSGMGSGPYDVTPSKSGGQNTALSGLDSSLIAQFVVGLISLNPTQQAVADVSGSGGISSFDAALIARFVVSLPGSGNAGNWTFAPVSRHYANVNANSSGQDYVALLMGDVSGNWNSPTSNVGGRPAGSTREAKPIGISAGQVTVSPNSEVTVPVVIGKVTGRGIVAYQFEMAYDPAVLTPSTTPTTAGGTLSENMLVTVNSDTPGLVKVVVFGALPLNGEGALINLHFTAIGAVGTMSPLTWQKFMVNEGDSPTDTVDGRVTVTQAAANELSISGNLLTAQGQGVPNTRVTLTGINGGSRSVISNGFGYYEFGDVEPGQTYTISVESRRYTFTSVMVSATDNLTHVDLIAQP